jgi:hypothetical protein
MNEAAAKRARPSAEGSKRAENRHDEPFGTDGEAFRAHYHFFSEGQFRSEFAAATAPLRA